MSNSLARQNVLYTVRLRTPFGKRVGFYGGLWKGYVAESMFVTNARWTAMPDAAVLFEKQSQAEHFRGEILKSHLAEINHCSKHLADLKKQRRIDQAESDYIAEEEKKLAEAIELIPYVRDAEIVRISVETVS